MSHLFAILSAITLHFVQCQFQYNSGFGGFGGFQNSFNPPAQHGQSNFNPNQFSPFPNYQQQPQQQQFYNAPNFDTRVNPQSGFYYPGQPYSSQANQATTKRSTTRSPEVTKINSRESGRLSEQACKRYAKPVTSTYQVTSLSLNAVSQDLETPNCTLSIGLIVNGEKAKAKEFPHMASIGFETLTANEYSFDCGGSLISENFVLTAAHCTGGVKRKPVIVRLGSLNLDAIDEPRKDVRISEIIKHEAYDQQKRNDIALLKLAEMLTFTSYIRPACLQQTATVSRNDVVAIGFGRTTYQGSVSRDLLKVGLKLIDRASCENQLDITLLSSQICTLGSKAPSGSHRDTCQGDSGGPIQIARTDNPCMLSIVGITSYGSGCGFANTPSIYTQVASYLDWIESRVWTK